MSKRENFGCWRPAVCLGYGFSRSIAEARNGAQPDMIGVRWGSTDPGPTIWVRANV